ncbi:shikimate dehydrogenase [Hyphococcus sp.]|uniref:shikimate dehydrogenase n=1 Tax=Hyphococcus sp. TaxID=2038636 RepID=UPI003CCB8412
MAVKRAPKLAGVIGWPIAQSLSPLIHTIWAHRAGVDAYYIPIPVEPDYQVFARTMDSLKTVGFEGVNVTLPHKEHALRYARSATDNARKAGAANMLTFHDDGAEADNSDIAGFTDAVREKAPERTGTALILGAGGAARGISIALKTLGFSNIAITNRTPEKASALAELFDLQTVDWASRAAALENADLLVNTTSLGMTGQPPLEMDLSALKPHACVADIVYAPVETPLLAQARDRAMKTVDGLAMLMHQAAPGARAWFGADPVVDDDLRRHLVNELNRRSET